jgi:histidine ammonia-lyase
VVNLSCGLTFDEIARVVEENEQVELGDAAAEKIARSFSFLDSFAEKKVIYGINTGFGPMAQYRVDDAHLRELQFNIIRSHSCGAGKPLHNRFVRAAMLSRLSNFAQGKSGISPQLAELLVAFLNNEIYPVVPEHGGVGASGDLVQMAHIGLGLIGEGIVSYKGTYMPASEAMKDCGLNPLEIKIREGLAIANGTSVMSGIASVNLFYAEKLFRWSLLASVMMNEIAESYDDFVSEPLAISRPHNGQVFVAGEMREHFKTSARLRKREHYLYSGKNDERIFEHKVQGYYSLRCVPQVLGPVYDTINFAKEIVEREFNSVCDNPVVDPESGSIYHGGNFHGDYVSFEMDKLKIAITKLTMLAERQLNYLFHDKINGILPPFVNLGTLGLNYGMQAAQFTATSTTAESQSLCSPVYIHSIPNNNDNQDIVSMGTNSALMAAKVVENAFQVIAIQYMSLLQAVDYLEISDKISMESKKIYKELREIFPLFTDDTPMCGDIERVTDYLKNN